MKTLEELRQDHALIIHQADSSGGNGYILRNGKVFASVVWSNELGWEHVSMSPMHESMIPSWRDMCNLHNMFFYDTESTIEIHPAKKDYINNKDNCLHLWRSTVMEQPLPPTCLVGFRDGQSWESIQREARNYEEMLKKAEEQKNGKNQ